MKNIKYIIYSIIAFMIPRVVFAADYSYRGKELKIVYIVGVALMVIRIVVPILLIVTGMIGLFQAMIQKDDSLMGKELKKLVPKVIIAIIIFILPSLLALLMKVVNKSSLWGEYSKCLSRPFSCGVSLWEDPPTINNSSHSGVTDITVSEEPGLPDADEMVAYAMQFKNKNVGTDCSGFVKRVLRQFNHIDSKMSSTSGYCDGRSRGSYGMYLLYKQRGLIMWERSSSAKTTEQALKTFPGNCKKGDLIFYTYGANDCVKHVVLYTGYENGTPMILDSNMQDNTVRYRGIDKVHGTAIPLACARAE